MVVKTITVTEEAYNALKHLKKDEQSFSEIIIEISSEKKGDISGFLGILKNKSKELAEMRKEIKKRKGEINKESSEREKKIRKRLNDIT
ncbi:hypothetical protein HYW75_02730 [Candidatus Pacearchaeota archaeon]|nr:hypothetical protein [Candidatus Pacearchaeota archaeon]